MSTVDEPPAKASTSSATSSGDGTRAGSGSIGWCGPSASSQQTSAGRISVATWLGEASEAATVAAASAATSSGVVERRTHPEHAWATASMSDSGRRTACGTWRGRDVDDGGASAGRCGGWRTVAEAGAEVQERAGRLVGHPGVAVGRTGGAPLEQAQDAPHGLDLVERGHEVHLRRAGVGEADVDAGVDEGLDECACAVHEW